MIVRQCSSRYDDVGTIVDPHENLMDIVRPARWTMGAGVRGPMDVTKNATSAMRRREGARMFTSSALVCYNPGFLPDANDDGRDHDHERIDVALHCRRGIFIAPYSRPIVGDDVLPRASNHEFSLRAESCGIYHTA